MPACSRDLLLARTPHVQNRSGKLPFENLTLSIHRQCMIHTSTDLKVGRDTISIGLCVSCQVILKSVQFLHELILIYVIRNTKILPKHILYLLMHVLQEYSSMQA